LNVVNSFETIVFFIITRGIRLDRRVGGLGARVLACDMLDQLILTVVPHCAESACVWSKERDREN
jgi:hypothetical protein